MSLAISDPQKYADARAITKAVTDLYLREPGGYSLRAIAQHLDWPLERAREAVKTVREDYFPPISMQKFGREYVYEPTNRHLRDVLVQMREAVEKAIQ